MRITCQRIAFTSLVMLAAGQPGCAPPEAPAPAPPSVETARPVEQEVAGYGEFTGTTQAVRSLEVRARVQGFLKSVHFKEGAIVDKDTLLFVIEPAPFEARLAEMQAKQKATEAKLKLAEAELQRAKMLLEKKAISKVELEVRTAQRDALTAELLGAKAAVEHTKIELSYTKIHSPFRGRVGRALVDPGNLVGAGEKTLLTTVRQMDPLHAFFDVPEPTVLAYLAWKSKQKSPADRKEVLMAVGEEEDFRHKGAIDFIDNRVDPATGTALARAEFPNPDSLLYPGLFARLRIPQEPKPALLVEERAIGTDLGGKYVLVVGAGNVVELRHVTLGRLYKSMRVVAEGLKPDDRYIVNGLQRARPGLPVTPQPAGAAHGSAPPAAASQAPAHTQPTATK